MDLSVDQKDLKTSVLHRGQPFVDDPVYAARLRRSDLEIAVSMAMEREVVVYYNPIIAVTQVRNRSHRRHREIVLGYERVRLNWRRPESQQRGNNHGR